MELLSVIEKEYRVDLILVHDNKETLTKLTVRVFCFIYLILFYFVITSIICLACFLDSARKHIPFPIT
jgi:hypothetical protein